MSRQPVAGAIIWWIAVMFGLAELITITIFHVTVSPECWNTQFYLWMCAVLAAEFVVFAWTANYALAARYGRGAQSGAVLIQLHLMALAWLVLTIALAVVATSPTSQGSYTLGIVYAILTFFFLLGGSALFFKDLALRREDRVTQAQRVELQVRVGDVEQFCQDLRGWTARNPAQLVAVDRLVKRLEGIRTSLDFAPPGKSGTLEEGRNRDVFDLNAEIAAAADTFRNELQPLLAGSGDPAGRLAALDATAGSIESLLRRRQQRLLVGG